MNTKSNSKEDLLKKILIVGAGILIFLLAFNFGGQTGTSILEALLFLVALASMMIGEKMQSSSDKKGLYVFLIPLGIFAFLASVSNFWLGFGVSNLSMGVLSVMGMFGAFVLGYKCQKNSKIDFRIVIYLILAGIGLYVLISLIYTMAVYGPFYALRNAGKEYFYDGEAYLVNKEIGVLYGFSFEAVSVAYAGKYGLLLSAALLALPFINRKENKAFFYTLLGFGAIGFLYMVLVPMKIALIIFALLAVVALLIRFTKLPQKAPKWEVITGFVLLGVVVVLVFFMLIMASQYSNNYAKLGFLAKIFDNTRFSSAINATIHTTVYSASGKDFLSIIFGMNPIQGSAGSLTYRSVSWGSFSSWIDINLLSFEFNALMEGGFIAFFALCVFMVFLIVMFRKYLHVTEKPDGIRVFSTMFVLAYFLYLSFQSSDFPLVHGSVAYVSPFMKNSLWLIVLFLIGHSYRPIFFAKMPKGALDEE